MAAIKPVLSFNISARRAKSTSKTTPTAAQPLGVSAGACAYKDHTVTALRRKHRMYVKSLRFRPGFNFCEPIRGYRRPDDRGTPYTRERLHRTLLIRCTCSGLS